jgi:hypothetical protein
VQSFEFVLDSVSKSFSAALYSSESRPHPALRVAALGERAGAIGCALFMNQG